MRLFGGSCGLMLRRRCQPGSGATRAEPVFPTKREGPARRRRRRAMVVEALMPPDAARVAIRIATRVATRVATVYTNAPKRRREDISIDLCTLLRHHGCPQRRNSPTVYTNAPKRRGEARSSHLCTLLRSQGHPQQSSPRRNSVHKRPETSPRGHFHRFVYTPASLPRR